VGSFDSEQIVHPATFIETRIWIEGDLVFEERSFSGNLWRDESESTAS
jgi:hypothetical protein